MQYARKDEVSRSRKNPGPHPERRKGESNHPRKSRAAEAPIERSRARLETHRQSGKGRDSKAGDVVVLRPRWADFWLRFVNGGQFEFLAC